jgi:hypothetical protein
MYTLSVVLFLLSLIFVVWMLLSVVDKHPHTAVVLAAWTLVSFSPIPLITWPTECRFINKRGRPCPKATYGFMFGCMYYYHWWPKFFARLGLKKEALREVQRREPSDDLALMYQAALEGKPVRVIMDNGPFGACVNLAGIVSAVAGVIGLLIH